MGRRAMNYIAIKPGMSLSTEVIPYLMNAMCLSDERGDLFVYESNFAPLWSRDGKGEHCTADLEEEVAIQRFLGSLPLDGFYMKRAGEECDSRGKWVSHPFQNEPDVQRIESCYQKALLED